MSLGQWTIYNNNGKICMFSGTDTDLALNMQDGDQWVSGYYSPDDYYVKDEELLAKPPKPDYPCDWVDDSWVRDDSAEYEAKKHLCGQTILSVASLEAQTNVNGALAAGELNEGDTALAAAFRAWVQAMRQAVADGSDFPDAPEGVKEFMEGY